MTSETWSLAASLATIVGVAIAYLAFRRARTTSRIDEAAVTTANFKFIRKYLEDARPALTKDAAEAWPDLFPSSNATRFLDTDFYTIDSWIPPSPIRVAAIHSQFDARPCEVQDPSPLYPPDRVLPVDAGGRRYRRYSTAYQLLCGPSGEKFHDELSYRLTEANLHAEKPYLKFELAQFFEFFDFCEGRAHHFAGEQYRVPGRHARHSRRLSGPMQVRWRRGRLQNADPFDLLRRPVPLGISTLTLRRRGPDVTFYLHDRDPSAVASAGGMIHLVPSGLFQPGSRSPATLFVDCDLQSNIAREYSEELLSFENATGDSPLSTDWIKDGPLAGFETALKAGSLQTWCLGMGLDPLTLWCDLMTVAVFDDDLFGGWFPVLHPNFEGRVFEIAKRDAPPGGIAFSERNVEAFATDRRIAPVAAACLRAAWQHRQILLD